MLEPAREGPRALFRNKAFLALAAGTAVLAGSSTSADAFWLNLQPAVSRQPEFVRPHVARPAKPGAATASRDRSAPTESASDLPARAKGILSIIISLEKQQLTLYSDGRPVAHSRVSTGTASHPTPAGVFSIIQKDRWHRSNLYDNAPMFFMQRITWSGVAMHQGIVPNHPASHGCIRLPAAFARQLWGVTRLGARVIVARGHVAPAEIAHERLFTLRREPLEAKLDPAASSAERVGAAHGALNVVQLGGTRQNATASDAAKPGDPALDAMAFAPTTPHEAEATSSEVVKSAYDAFEAFKVRRMKSVADSAAVAEVRPLKPGPISVFVSRKEGRLFVRKGFEPLFDVPVTFARPEQPLGTHVFTALALKDDATTMRWNVVSIPTGTRKAEKGKKVEWSGPVSTAAEALDRITIPPEALEQISELMSPGASLVVSDQGLGPETGKGTDFIVLTR